MYRKSQCSLMVLLLASLLTTGLVARAQNSANIRPPASVTILDSTKEQDGLVGSVRRVKTESAKLELKAGKVVEGPRQLVELTTYALTGNRIENVSYPVSNTSVGKEEYKYDDQGHIIEMTLRGEGGAILSREAYAYEFDRFRNWTKMLTSLVVFEDGQLKREPVEVTYRTFTYYYDDIIATVVSPPAGKKMPAIPASSGSRLASDATLENRANQLKDYRVSSLVSVPVDNPPPPELPLTKEEKTVSSSDPKDRSVSLAVKPEINSRIPSAAAEKQRVDQTVQTDPAASGKAQPAPQVTRTVPGTAALTAVNTAKMAESKNVPAESPTAAKMAMGYYKRGVDFFEVGDVKAAVTAYLHAIELEPRSAEFHLALGHAYLKLEKNKEAAKTLKESVRLNPQVAEAQYGLGLASFRLDRHSDAADAFKKATRLRPEMAKAHYGLALAYQELGRLDAVIDQYRILERLDRNLAKQLAQLFPDFNLPCKVPPFCK